MSFGGELHKPIKKQTKPINPKEVFKKWDPSPTRKLIKKSPDITIQ